MAKTFREKDLRKGRFSERGSVYAVVSNVWGRRKLLVPDTDQPQNAPAARIILDSLVWMHEQNHIECIGYTVMPEHIHLVIWLKGERPLEKVMQTFGSYTGVHINKVLERSGKLWQKGYRDRSIRNEEELYNQLNYIRNNPVAAGFVEQAEDWPWCEVYPEW